MKQTHKYWAALAGVVAAVAGGTTAHAQSADALIDKLVDKGILTPGEAKDLREEVDKDFTRAYQTKSGMADWVTSLRLNGDFRGRIEHFNAKGDDTDDIFKDRTRFRYRLRLGVVANLFDNFEAGLRLSSSEPASGGPAGGDPISGNTTMQDNGSRKFIYVDLAYGKWTMLNNSALFSALSVGKIANPFVFSDMVFDGDYNPEGFADQIAFHLSDAHDLKLNLGLFSLDEIGADSDDPFMAGAQIRFDSKWSPHLITSVGVGMLGIANDEALDSSAAGVWTVPNQNGGNTRVTAPDAPPGRINQLAYNMNPIIADVAITYNLEKFFHYNALFPITFAGDVMYNPAAPDEAGNKAFSVGVTFGKAGKKGLWEVGYRYKYLGANSWWEEVVDSDFGALYQTALPGGGSGYVAGTNVRGHIVSAGYSPADAFTFNVKYFATQLIRENPPGSSSDMGRLQVDANWKF
jgi:hypothetical protein